jgi:trehalose-6-phosphate synthase
MTCFAEPTQPTRSPSWLPHDGMLSEEQLIVVSDRAPWSHLRVGEGVQAVQPASGLVNAIEPVMQTGVGTRTWIAHGSGNADREVTDVDDTWRVTTAADPNGGYRMRYLWLSADEQRGYRDGAANSGLWPLCHMVHVRPTFADSDWAAYRRVNQRFADAVLREARRADPIVWIHDYHLALVPALVRQRLPQARILGFWHIPWGHPEQMAICPWLAELTAGLLGCDALTFQTAAHRQHFNASARRCGVPATIDSNRSTMRPGSLTQVRDCAVSVAWPTAAQVQAMPAIAHCRRAAAQLWSVPVGGKLIVGIDRFDYTKGLIERLHAVEQLLTLQPEWIGRLRFVQIAAPTRSNLPAYATFQTQVRDEVARINTRYARRGWTPVLLLDSCHDRAAVTAAYRAADVCLVTPLHDGMNLVCKEFIAARDDEQGVLVLSEHAGAAAELTGALCVNPHHLTQVAEALHQALTMLPAEQHVRMRTLRAAVQRHSAQHWAASLLQAATTVHGQAAPLHLVSPPHHAPRSVHAHTMKGR